MSKTYTGGCACGAIRYEISDEPIVIERVPVPRLSTQERHRHGSYLTFADRRRVEISKANARLLPQLRIACLYDVFAARLMIPTA